MSEINFNELNIQKKTIESKILTIGGKDIEIYQSLPSRDKFDLIEATIASCEIDGVYNTYLFDISFKLNVIYLYTNIIFTREDKEDELALYDLLENNGIIEAVFALIPEKEITDLLNKAKEVCKSTVSFKASMTSLFNNLLVNLPEKANQAQEILKNLNSDKMKELLSIANKWEEKQ